MTNSSSLAINSVGLALLSLGVAASSAYADSLRAERLLCEHRENPIGIDADKPELSWIVSSSDNGASQTAYQVLVASTKAGLAVGEADLWDSGKVESNRTFGVLYDGKPLGSHQRCYWAVRAWDQGGQPGPWSTTAHFAIGLLEPDSWEAKWIGYDAARDRSLAPAPMEGANWIAHPKDDPLNTPSGNRVYVLRLELPNDTRVRSAEAFVAADDKHWLAVNEQMVVHGEPGWEVIKPVKIDETLRPGTNELRFNVENGKQGPSALIAKIVVTLETGETMVFESSPDWLAFDSPGHHWPAEAIPSEKLVACQTVAEYCDKPWGKSKLQTLFLPPVARFRRPFDATKPIESAMLYVSALGICDAYLNGERVSDEYFTPGWTDYRKRVYYRAYDVTGRINSGENVLGAELADGWYSGYIGWGRNRDHYGESPRLSMQLRLTYADGSSETITTDDTWRATDGPTREGDFLMGELHDSRLEDGAWSTPGSATETWAPVETGGDLAIEIEAHPGPPVAAVEEFTPVSVAEPEPGVFVYDMGRNFAGIVRLTVEGEPGQEVRLRFAERLKEDGTLYTTNLRGARTIDTFVCAGGKQTWSPRFTFHGFQYVEVTGVDTALPVESVTGVALSSDTPDAGSFACSDEMLNQLVSNTYWTQLANFIDVPTDCPQRDERLGWTGDAQVYIGAACLHADVQAFFDKWLVDLIDGQRDDGQFPMVAPLVVAGDDGGPAWADAGVICPWRVYEAYGDEQLLRRCYPAMKRFVEFCRNRSKDGVLPPDDYHCFGDWLSVNADTPKDVIYTAYYAHSTRLLSHAAETLGYAEDAAEYTELADGIASAFRSEFVDADGVIRGDTQCCYVLALAYDLLDEKQQAQAAAHLVADIEERGDHLSTGFVGTKDLMLVLAKIGRNDVAYRLLHQEAYPSWGFSIKHGATSIWERWDGWTPDRGFQDPGMNSFAHYSFGAVYQWMVENIGGIRNGGDAYKHIIFAPTIGERLGWADVAYASVRGPIRSSWRKTDAGIEFTMSVPANCVATAIIQDATQDDIVVAPKAAQIVSTERSGETRIELPSGEYSIKVKR